MIGYLAGSIQTARTLPQIVCTLRTKKTTDISLLMIIFSLVGALLWLIYGIMVRSMPIIITDLISSLFLFYLLLLKIKFDGIRRIRYNGD